MIQFVLFCKFTTYTKQIFFASQVFVKKSQQYVMHFWEDRIATKLGITNIDNVELFFEAPI